MRSRRKSLPRERPLPPRRKNCSPAWWGHYQHCLGPDSRGLRYLKEERGITHTRTLTHFGAGYADGSLKEILPEDEEIAASLKQIGILNARGNEAFYRCVVFPLYSHKGAVVGLYGRNIGKGRVSHRYLPGPRTGVVNRQAVKGTDSVLLTESIIDAVTLYDRGFTHVIPIYGVNGLLDEHLSLLQRHVGSAHLVFDADDAGQKAAERVAARLKEKQIKAYPVILPVKDANLYFKSHSAEAFKQLLAAAGPKDPERTDKEAQPLYTPTDHGFIFGTAGRQYEVKGICRSDTQLKATVKASREVAGGRPFELSTIDLYSSRSRLWFGKLCAELFGASEAQVKADMDALLERVEAWRPPAAEQATAALPTGKAKAEALRFLKNPDIFAEILADLDTLGVTGEETNKLVGYLAAVSRKTDEPLSVLIQSRSAAGKSTLQDAVLSLVPEEDYVKYTRVTDQALFYKEEDALVHKLLAIEEEAGMGGAAYSIRNIQSASKITVAATGKDPGSGKLKTEEYTVNGPVAVMITTTAAELEGETASRFLFLTIDESAAMTAAIHRMQRQAETLEGLLRKKRSEHITQKHHNAQRLLKPLAVVNPYSQHLRYPDRSLRTRRDHKKYLGLIRTVAYLRQYQREIRTVEVSGEPVDYIEVTLDDIETANRLANQVLGQCLDELAPPSRTLLNGIYRMVRQLAEENQCSQEEVFFTRRMIREHLSWSDWQIRAHIRQLEELEYLHARMGKRGKEYSYALNYRGQGEDGDRCYLNLTPVAELKRLVEAKGKR